MTETTPSPQNVPEPWQPRFGIGGMLLVMLVFSVMAAGGYYLFRGIRQGERSAQLAFILFTVAGPLLLLVAVSLLRLISTLLGGTQTPDPPEKPDSPFGD